MRSRDAARHRLPVSCDAQRTLSTAWRQATLLAIFAHIQHSPSDQVIHQSQIAVPFPKRLLINTDLTHQFSFAALQATLHRPLQDAVDLVPTQFQKSGYRFLAGRLQPFHRQGLKQYREPTRWFRPRQPDYLHAVVPTFASWRLRMQNRLILAGVQVPALPFRLMVVQLAGRTAFRALPIDQVIVSEINVDFAGFQFQIHRVYEPGTLNPENAPIELVILHPRHCRMSRPASSPH